MDAGAAIMLSIVIFLGLFFLLREVFCWYWKINARLAVQEKILSQLISLRSQISKEGYQIKVADIQQLLIDYRRVNPEDQSQEVSPNNKQESESDPASEPQPEPQPDPTPPKPKKPKKPKKPYCPRCNEKNTFGEYCKFCGAQLEDVDEE